LHGFTFPLEAPPRDMLLSVGPRSWFVTRSPVPGSKPKGVLSAEELHEADQLFEEMDKAVRESRDAYRQSVEAFLAAAERLRLGLEKALRDGTAYRSPRT